MCPFLYFPIIFFSLFFKLSLTASLKGRILWLTVLKAKADPAGAVHWKLSDNYFLPLSLSWRGMWAVYLHGHHMWHSCQAMFYHFVPILSLTLPMSHSMLLLHRNCTTTKSHKIDILQAELGASQHPRIIFIII